MKLPENYLDIKVPTISRAVSLERCAEVYPHEFTGRDVKVEAGKRRYTVALYPVTSSTPTRAREAVEVIAHYFRRELGFDAAGYDADETQDRQDRIFLLLKGDLWDSDRHAVGSIVFRWMEYSNAPHQLVLSWVWIHPFLRGTGVFTSYWKLFREIYGDFHVEQPYSKAMSSFLAKMNEIHDDTR